MAGVVEMCHARLIEPQTQPRHAFLMPLAFVRIDFRWRMLVSAPAATAGGSDVVKMKPEAKLRMKSQIVAEAAT